MHSWPSLTVTTSQDVRIIHQGLDKAIHPGHGLYYSLSWDRDNIYLLARGGIRSSGFPDVFVMEPSYTVTDTSDGMFYDDHQIHCDGTSLYVTATHFNHIVEVNLENRTNVLHNRSGFGYDKNPRTVGDTDYAHNDIPFPGALQ